MTRNLSVCHPQKKPSEAGFVLPAVLAFIAAFTFILLTTATTLEQSKTLAIAFERQTQLEHALDAAEAKSAFYFVTSRSVPGGLLLLPEKLDVTAIALGEAPPPAEEGSAIWRADGGILVFEEAPFKTWAIYHDTAGLISLSTARPEVMMSLLRDFDIDGSEAAVLAARLQDYQDEDRTRRPMGAERADYRLRGRPQPSDSPIRMVSELGRVLGWENLAFINKLEFLANVTASSGTDQPVARFATDRLKLLLADLPNRSQSQVDVLTLAANLRVLPSDRGRFVLVAQDVYSGDTKVRLVEIARRPGAATAPYSRVLVAEFTDPELPESWRLSEDVEFTVSP
ncbi:MAG: hypothetical protein Hens2KO_22090 [Henriciella sp.]